MQQFDHAPAYAPKLEEVHKLIAKNKGYWTRGRKVYTARRSGTVGLLLLTNVSDIWDVIEVKITTLASRWSYLETLEGSNEQND